MKYVESEKKANEIFVGNTKRNGNSIDHLIQKGMRTVRFGVVALCVDGKILDKMYAPIFINKSEEGLYDDIMMKKTFGDHYRRY